MMSEEKNAGTGRKYRENLSCIAGTLNDAYRVQAKSQIRGEKKEMILRI
jgi:hypothetical protein